jgi:hypothetical protein
MILDRPLGWLGFHRQNPVLGVHLAAEHLTVVALRSRPLRLVGVGRELVYDAAVAADDDRAAAALAVELRQLVDALDLGPGADLIATVEPAADLVDLGLGGSPHALGCPVRRRTHDRLVGMVAGAGLELARIDAVPVSLARLALQLSSPPVAIVAGRWQVTVTEGRLHAQRVGSPPTGALLIGSPPGRLAPVERLTPIQLTRSLRSQLDLGRDAPALGAALAGFGLGPLVTARPQAEVGRR